MKDIDDITGDILDSAIKLHRELGPGLLESVYEMVLSARLSRLGYAIVRQSPVDFEFEGMRFEGAFRIDIIVDDRVVIEIKSIQALNAAHRKQLLTYLRLSKRQIGLLINFGGATLKEGYHRVVNDYRPSASPRLRVNQKVA